MVLDDPTCSTWIRRSKCSHVRGDVSDIPGIPTWVLVACISGLTCQFCANNYNVSIRRVCILRDGFLHISLLEMLSLLTLERPTPAVIEFGYKIDTPLTTASLSIVVAGDDARVRPYEVSAERLESLPRPIRIVEGQQFRRRLHRRVENMGKRPR
jgi:hypothetical protein